MKIKARRIDRLEVEAENESDEAILQSFADHEETICFTGKDCLVIEKKEL